MTWQTYFDLSLYAALVCVLLGYAPFPWLKRKWSLVRYSVLLVVCVFGASAAFYFAPLVLSQLHSQSQVVGSGILGPLGALAGLSGFWIYVLGFRRDV
jgi:hypothetical protein